MPSLSGRNAIASSSGLPPPPSCAENAGNLTVGRCLCLTQSSQELAVKGSSELLPVPSELLIQHSCRVSTGGFPAPDPIRGCCHFAGAPSSPSQEVLPSANGTEGKIAVLTNGVQPLQPPRLRAPVRSISNICLHRGLRLLGPKR